MNKTNTISGQLLEGIKRLEFEKLVKQHKTDKYCKGFTTWTHFTSMMQESSFGVGSISIVLCFFALVCGFV